MVVFLPMNNIVYGYLVLKNSKYRTHGVIEFFETKNSNYLFYQYILNSKTMTQETFDKAQEIKSEIYTLKSLIKGLNSVMKKEDYLPDCLAEIDTLDTSARISQAIEYTMQDIIVYAEARINRLNKTFKAL